MTHSEWKQKTIGVWLTWASSFLLVYCVGNGIAYGITQKWLWFRPGLAAGTVAASLLVLGVMLTDNNFPKRPEPEKSAQEDEILEAVRREMRK